MTVCRIRFRFWYDLRSFVFVVLRFLFYVQRVAVSHLVGVVNLIERDLDTAVVRLSTAYSAPTTFA